MQVATSRYTVEGLSHLTDWILVKILVYEMLQQLQTKVIRNITKEKLKKYVVRNI